MLLYQGILAYELWNEVKVTDTLADIVYMALQDALYGINRGDNIVLIGYMGAGKTTVGKAVAEKKGYDFIDTDAYIEQHEGMSIPDIFEKKGETYFRELETKILLELKEKLHHTIIATGGGLPLRKENSDILKSLGTVYYLKACADTIYNRVKECTNRPLLQCDNPYEKITSMLETRDPIYEKACNIRVITDNQELDNIVEYIGCI